MSKTINKNVICPRCFSNELYRFGKDKNGYQKYQCKICKRQLVFNAKPMSLSIVKNIIFGLLLILILE